MDASKVGRLMLNSNVLSTHQQVYAGKQQHKYERAAQVKSLKIQVSGSAACYAC